MDIGTMSVFSCLITLRKRILVIYDVPKDNIDSGLDYLVILFSDCGGYCDSSCLFLVILPHDVLLRL